MRSKTIHLFLAAIALASCSQPHVHDFGSEWASDEDYHWHACECGEIDGKGSHKFDDGKEAKAKTCTEDGDKVYTCETCGYEYHIAIPKGHVFAATYTFDETHHWKAATCEHSSEKSENEAHELVADPSDGFYQICKKCDYRGPAVAALAKPTNLSFANNVLTFGAVEYATKYDIRLYDGETELLHVEIGGTTYEVNYAPGTYKIGVTAKHDAIKSPEATLDIDVLLKDGNLLIEAEDCLLNPAHYSYDDAAHGKGYALGFNDCGQGIAFNYYAFEAGSRTVTLCYATGVANSKMTLTLDGVYATDVIFPENTGWFGDSKRSATVDVTVSFKQGWNHVALFKNGTGSDDPQYGGYVQLDYLTIQGTNGFYSLSDHADYDNESYRFEAEAAQWHWSNADTRPANWGAAFSSSFGLGNIDASGDGVAFNFKVSKTGAYKVQLAYGRDGSATSLPFEYRLNDGEAVSINLTNASTGWDSVSLDAGFTLDLVAGTDYKLDLYRPNGGTWLTIDYVVIALA